jgi:hypothetical protein
MRTLKVIMNIVREIYLLAISIIAVIVVQSIAGFSLLAASRVFGAAWLSDVSSYVIPIPIYGTYGIFLVPVLSIGWFLYIRVNKEKQGSSGA